MEKSNIEHIILGIKQELDNNIRVFSDTSVEYGKLGAAIFYYYGQIYFNADVFLKKGESLIESSIDLLSSQKLFNKQKLKFKGDSIGFRLSSFGKGLLFVQNNFNLRYDFSSYYLCLNDVLHDISKQAIDKKDHDFFSGTLSTGYFFLNQYKYTRDSFSKWILNSIVQAILKDIVVLNKEEIYWHSPMFNNRVYLGLSHGSAMLINFLCKIIEYEIYEGDMGELENVLFKAINFIMRRERNFVHGYFPHLFLQTENKNVTQLSMCYGDLGILYAVHNALQLFDWKVFEARVNQLLIKTSRRKLNKAYTQDSSILYGCSGLYYIFKDLYQRTYNDAYLQSYLYWHRSIFKFRVPEKRSLVGFQFEYERNVKVDKAAVFSFYWGIGGIGVTLMKENLKTLPNLNELLLIG